ncbi:aldo/keto reductase [Amnibacterium endophyticum]|uniref:Aldo/keto reductase n=1 Tax=Amnibacterium endophyticum TaxID=2109337 RepID=A0ABW4LHT2_9MICO
MPALTDTFTIADDVRIPKIGFGTWQIPDGSEAYDAVRSALDAGYRHIDTALAYGNEESVGRAVRDSGIDRDELFITTKLPAEVKDADGARAAFERSQSGLDLGVVDLYLIHAPWPWSSIGSDHRDGNIAVWKVFEQLFADGRARSIGVSNFSVEDLESLTGATDVQPHVNQIEWHVGKTQGAVTRWCQARGILVEGYSPLATGRLLDEGALQQVAERVGRTPAQVAIRYLLERDVLPLPKSVTPSRIRENADVDFSLDAAELAALDGAEER